MKHCLQCGTVAANSEAKCEECGFEHFTNPTPSLTDELASLREANAELVKALRACVNAINYQHEPSRALVAAEEMARAAISKHKG